MADASAGHAPGSRDVGEISLLSLGSVLLRWRRTVIALGLLGALAGLGRGLLSTRVYVSSATFLPQGAEGSASGLALAASQLGIRVPTSGGGWGPPVYVELLRSRALLGRIVLDSVVVAEEGARRVALMDLLKVKANAPEQRVDRSVRILGGMVESREVKALNAVEVVVTSRWPSVSLALAQKMVQGVNRFNVETRRSQATAERQFVDAQAHEAERALREAEDQLQSFLQRNRVIAGSPQLEFQRDRLQREVNLRQQVYTSLIQNGEEARIREVRDTPVITVLEEPRLPVVGESRKAAQKAVLGGLAGGMIAVLIALLANGVAGARRSPSEAAREFFELMEEATPRWLRPWVR
jgi:uncharacterized protein involved in exopolysaccharide biosynthesis